MKNGLVAGTDALIWTQLVTRDLRDAGSSHHSDVQFCSACDPDWV